VDPYGDFGRYLTAIDWGDVLIALVASLVAGAVVLAVAITMGERAIAAAPGWPPRLARGLGRLARRGRPEPEPPTRWLCGACLSWNPPGSEGCASGCGPRAACEMRVPPMSGDEPGIQRGGRRGRPG
jgi:hypothetical protein